MVDLGLQFTGLLLLLGGLALGYRRWIAPRASTLNFRANGLLLLMILTLMGGFIGSPSWWLDDARSFAWDLPPLAGRMLASAGWSFVVVSFLALERPSRRRVRLVLLLLAVYLAPLVVVTLLFHLDRFNFSAPLTYGFFILAGGMAVATIGYLLWQPILLANDTRDAAPSSTGVKVWLGIVAVVTGLWGLALFLTDRGTSALIWVWPGDLLTSRLIGVMLLAVAAGVAASLRYADMARMMLSLALTYGLGLAAASAWDALTGKPIQLSYLIVFGLIALGSAALLIADRSVRQA